MKIDKILEYTGGRERDFADMRGAKSWKNKGIV